jgi:sorting nexin-1/2
MYTVKSFDN